MIFIVCVYIISILLIPARWAATAAMMEQIFSPIDKNLYETLETFKVRIDFYEESNRKIVDCGSA